VQISRFPLQLLTLLCTYFSPHLPCCAHIPLSLTYPAVPLFSANLPCCAQIPPFTYLPCCALIFCALTLLCLYFSTHLPCCAPYTIKLEGGHPGIAGSTLPIADPSLKSSRPLPETYGLRNTIARGALKTGATRLCLEAPNFDVGGIELLTAM